MLFLLPGHSVAEIFKTPQLFKSLHLTCKLQSIMLLSVNHIILGFVLIFSSSEDFVVKCFTICTHKFEAIF